MTETDEARSGANRTSARWFILIATTSITLAGLLAFGNSLDGAWALDDFPRIVENESIRMEQFSLSRLRRAATSPPERERWVTNASFALNYYLNGLNPSGFRFVNVGLHILTALGLFFFLVLLIRQFEGGGTDAEKDGDVEGDGTERNQISLYIAWATALLWVVHPVLTQAVNYTAQRGVLLSGLFYIWGLWGFLEWRRGNALKRSGYLLFSMLMFILSVKSKEIGGTFVLAAGLLYWLEPDTEEETAHKNWMFGPGVGLLFALVSLYLLGGIDGTLERLDRLSLTEPVGNKRFSTWQRVMTEWRVMVFYLSLVVFPGLNRLNLEHDIQLSTGLFSPPSTVLALIFIIVLLVGAYKLRHRLPVVAFGIFWFFLQLVVTSTVLNLELIFEHRVYLAVVGPILIFVYLLFRKTPMAWFYPAGLVVLLVGVLSWATYERNYVWGDTLTLYRDAVRKAPEKPRNQGNLGVAYAKEAHRLIQSNQQYRNAFSHMAKALQLHRTALRKSSEQERPLKSVFTENIDNLLMDLTAIWREIDGREKEPEWTETLVKLHEEFLYSVHPKYVENRQALRKQLAELRIYLAGVYRRLGKTKKADDALKKLIDRHPERTRQMLDQIEDPELRRLLKKRIDRMKEDE